MASDCSWSTGFVVSSALSILTPLNHYNKKSVENNHVYSTVEHSLHCKKSLTVNLLLQCNFRGRERVGTLENRMARQAYLNYF